MSGLTGQCVYLQTHSSGVNSPRWFIRARGINGTLLITHPFLDTPDSSRKSLLDVYRSQDTTNDSKIKESYMIGYSHSVLTTTRTVTAVTVTMNDIIL